MKPISLAAAALACLSCLAPSQPREASSISLAPADVESAAKAELLELHRAARRAHFHRDVDALVAGMGSEFTMVRDGKIQLKSRDDVRKQFTEYFRGAEFSAWDDLEPPIIHISPDGKMGWMIVRLRIAYTKTDDSGAQSKEDTVMAWMSVYEKHGGKWLHVANASTTAP